MTITPVSLDPSSYTSDAVFDAEQRAIFAREWVPVVRSNDISAVGDYAEMTLAGEPILVLRDENGAIRAFSNVCRHRSMKMLDGVGNVSRIRCPYHLWGYRLDGSLSAAPFMGEDLDKKLCSLPEFPTTSWQGWVFVSLADDPPSFESMVGDLAARLPDGLDRWVTAATVHFESPFNWKVIVENGSESYHNIGIHQATIQPVWPGGTSRPIETHGDYVEIRHDNDEALGTFTAYTLFPQMTFTVQEPDPWILWYDLRINGRDDCDMYLQLLMPPKAANDSDLVEFLAQSISDIHQEDIDACARVMAGLHAPSARSGPLSPLEAPLAKMHAWLAERLDTHVATP